MNIKNETLKNILIGLLGTIVLALSFVALYFAENEHKRPKYKNTYVRVYGINLPNNPKATFIISHYERKVEVLEKTGTDVVEKAPILEKNYIYIKDFDANSGEEKLTLLGSDLQLYYFYIKGEIDNTKIYIKAGDLNTKVRLYLTKKER